MSTQYGGGLPKFREELQAILKELEVKSLEDTLNKIIPHIEKNAYIEDDVAEYRLHISVTQSIAEASEMLTLNSSFYGDDRNGYDYKSMAEVAEKIICGCINWFPLFIALLFNYLAIKKQTILRMTLSLLSSLALLVCLVVQIAQDICQMRYSIAIIAIIGMIIENIQQLHIAIVNIKQQSDTD